MPMITSLDAARQQLAQIRAKLTGAETALARIRAHGDPSLAEKEASTRQLIEALTVQAEALALQLNGPRMLH